ncbi:hypothetical protein H8356DRAFT_1627299 [Neocallimastix lanati (nom. inval.)]|jgi:hypothetical protein|uniref:RRM domain-containing protein n=1 Tax=Neocallimastix californiae TaxID=1754190 RepID=A0A1Y2DL46_9FUNG|nr:hypothetical protein H8356DRAFT_1627299 [Neocallimastix sp. JGI-2020a]ORY59856.1 hypothetical protein LY90DRAFT_668819 [Neocallimastix californiae]|eukprot:ORY59856.1 hypothetical protein LY90DRAFT_668819 [Neocallimastix californiae]
MEEITTIFVVGFPDDMNEREFQNMFIFNPGFEAATLKIPTPNKDGRKQIIGFAKFHTKMDALNAMEVLTGRQIDFEKGSILKAEMAKKNLHTKKTMMNMYYPGSSMKNACMQYHNMVPDNNCVNFNNNMVNNLGNQLLKDDNNAYQLNNMNRGMNLPSNTVMGPLANNGFMLPGARERNGNMSNLNTLNLPFMDQNSSLYNGNRNLYKLPNYQNMDMNHSAAVMNNNKPTFDKLYKNIPGNSNSVANSTNTSTNSLYGNSIFNFLSENPGVPKGLKQQSIQNGLFSFNNSMQKPMQQPNTFASTPSGFINNLYRQPSSLLDSDFPVNNNQFNSNSTNQTSTNAVSNNISNKFNQSSSGLNGIDSSFSNDLYGNNFNVPLNYFANGNNEIMKNRSSIPTSLHDNGNKDASMEELKKVGPMSTSTTPLFFSSPINKTPGFMDINNSNGIDNLGKGSSTSLMDSSLDINNKFYNMSLNMNMDKSSDAITTKGDASSSNKENEDFESTPKSDEQTNSEKSKDDSNFAKTSSTCEFMNTSTMNNNNVLKSNFTFNLFNNENSTNILDSLNKNDSFGLISKFSSSSINLQYKKPHFEKSNEKELEPTIQSNEESSSTINSNTISNAKSNNSLNSVSDFTLNEGNTDNKTEPESSIFSSLSNLTSEPIIPPPQVYSSVGTNINSKTIANENN